MKNYIREYWEQINSGKIAACKRLKQQYKKLIDDLDNPKDPWVFDLEFANYPIDFIEKFCRHSKGEWMGKKIKLELFQKAKLQATFGFIHKDTKFRKYNEVFTLEARKNGKSTELAAVGTYMMIGDGEGGAEVYSVATKKDQAKRVFDEAYNMILQSPQLSELVRKRKTDLYFENMFSSFKPLASDSNTLDGLNVHCSIIDELHAIKNRNLYDVIKQGMGARKQPINFMITTAGFVRESIYDSIYEYACNVLDGIVDDDRFLAFIYELDNREEWTDPKAWQKANPGLGTIRSLDNLAEEVERAKNDPSFLKTVLTKNFNIRETESGSWLSFSAINNKEKFDIKEFEGTYAISGTDLSATTDLSCATLLMMKPGSEKKYAHQMYFLPKDLLGKRVKEDKIPYDIWAERGLLTLCEGNKVDLSDITAWYVKMYKEHGIIPYWNYYDPWSSSYWVDEMITQGFKMCQCRQGYKTLSQPMKELGADLGSKLVNYDNNPILKWCLTNVKTKQDDNGNIRPVKNNQPGLSQKKRIDGAVSLLIAYVGLFENLADYKALIGW